METAIVGALIEGARLLALVTAQKHLFISRPSAGLMSSLCSMSDRQDISTHPYDKAFQGAGGAGLHAREQVPQCSAIGLMVGYWSAAVLEFHEKEVGAIARDHQQSVLAYETQPALPGDTFFQDW